MGSRCAILTMLMVLFVSVGAFALPGNIDGEVTDSSTLKSIFGARVDDVTSMALPIPGSFVGDGVYFFKDLPEGSRSIRVTAPGYDSKTLSVTVIDSTTVTKNFRLDLTTSLNTVDITLPIGGAGSTTFLLPPIVEAVQEGVVVASTFVRNGLQYRLSGIPNGSTTFRSASAFYVVGTTTVVLAGGTTVVTIPVSVPAARADVVTGQVTGIVTDSIPSEIVALVIATKVINGGLVKVGDESSGENGVYLIDLLPTGTLAVQAFADELPFQSDPESVFIIGGQFAMQDLQALPIDPNSKNFIPIIEDLISINFNEDTSDVINFENFSVCDSDGSFPTGYTLYVGKGQNYTTSSIQQSSAQITPGDDYNGPLSVPIIITDGENTSVPAILSVTIDPVDDPIVHVNFDTGAPAAKGGTGGVDKPLLSVGEAINAVTVAGAILIKGGTSNEAPLTINQSVTLQNNNAGPAVVIDPGVSRQAESASSSKSGFVSRSGSPR